jgi:hypothetical protein
MILQGFGDESASAIGHIEGMTQPWEPVWQCRGCDSRISAVLDCMESEPRNDPRADANDNDGKTYLSKSGLVCDGR